jgi:Tfp pilus assembly protein PilF
LDSATLALVEMDLRENRLDSARQGLTELLASNPKNIAALLVSAALEKRAGSDLAAISNYRTVLSIDGSNLVALNNMAYLMASQDPDQALKFAQQALEISPQNPAVEDTLGWVFYRKGIFGQATQYLKAAVTKEPTPRRQFHLAMCYLKDGNESLGRQTLAAALKQDPSLPKTEQGW